MLRKSSAYFFVKLAENQANWINWQEKLNDSSFLHAEEVRRCSRAIGNLLIQKKLDWPLTASEKVYLTSDGGKNWNLSARLIAVGELFIANCRLKK